MTLDRRGTLKRRVVASFESAFGEKPELLVAAPGRVNLIGEHTDYNDGFVLPCAIGYETIVAITPKAGRQINAVAGDYGDAADSFDPGEPFARQPTEWKNHLRGLLASFAARGYAVGGADIAFAGNIPRGAGLSSSASLNVALAKAIAEVNDFTEIDVTEQALLAQQAENDFVGTACGIMDQFASARSNSGQAMLLDCRSLEISSVPMPDDIAVLVIQSGIKRGLVDSAYNERRAQCDRAAAHYCVPALRDLDIERLEADRRNLDEVSYRRARHVVSENDRTVRAAKALSEGDLQSLSRLMADSHASMRDDFEITLPAIDDLVEVVAAKLNDQGGVRMTGGGFGGCIVALLQNSHRDAVREAVHSLYGKRGDGEDARILECVPMSGVSIIEG